MDWLEELRGRGRLEGPVTDAILRRHGARGKRAIDAVSEGRVKEYLDFVVVVGEHDEYVVEDETCQCDDQRYNLDEGEWCWHVIAAKVADATGSVDEHDMWYSEVRDLL